MITAEIEMGEDRGYAWLYVYVCMLRDLIDGGIDGGIDG